jgi:hypothetical protein
VVLGVSLQLFLATWNKSLVAVLTFEVKLAAFHLFCKGISPTWDQFQQMRAQGCRNVRICEVFDRRFSMSEEPRICLDAIVVKLKDGSFWG